MPKKKESIYLETSVISAYFDFKKQDTERKKITRNFWHKFKAKYTFVISEAVTMELEAKKEYRSQFLEVIKEIKELRINNKLKRLADRYIKAKIIRPGKYLDALHLACTTIYKLVPLKIFLKVNYKRKYYA